MLLRRGDLPLTKEEIATPREKTLGVRNDTVKVSFSLSRASRGGGTTKKVGKIMRLILG